MINWLKRNWAVIILIIIGVVYLKNNWPITKLTPTGPLNTATLQSGNGSYEDKMMMYAPEVAPSESSDRLVIQNSSLSLQVKDVADSIDKIRETADSLGGFLVNSDLNKPEEAANGTISVRVPEDKRTEAMAAFKQMAVKVVSESVVGTDVTDQYVDLAAQLEVLTKTKQKFEDILNRATVVADLLDVQRELISIQSQIDSVKGQQKYYEQSAKLSKITVYLSTDELALPYSPTNEWRPAVIFKEAVRTLVSVLRSVGTGIIYVVVLAPVWIAVLLIIRLIRKKYPKQ